MKVSTSILLYNTLHGLIGLFHFFAVRSRTGPGIMMLQWSVLPIAESANACPCNYCGVDLYCHEMNHTLVPFGLPTQGVQKILLHRNHITAIYGNDFRDMVDLKYLVLDHNNITSVDKNAFSDLQNLISLYLEYNMITRISEGTLTDLPKLVNLFLNNNQLTSFPVDIPYTSSLEKLNVDNNQINRIHWTSFLQLRSLLTLNLWMNPLICDCNTKELIKWLTTTSSGMAISTESPPEACVNDSSIRTRCEPIQIEKLQSSASIYIANETATIHCDVTRDLLPFWKTPYSALVFPYKRGRVTAFINGTLKIRNTVGTDNGTYTCYAQYSSRYSRDMQSITINIIEGRAPKAIPIESNVEVTVGEQARLSCRVDGAPSPVVTWYGPDKSRIRANDTISFEMNGRTLVLKSTTDMNDGTWTCKASNAKGASKGRIQLTVIPPVSDNTMMIIIAASAGGVVLLIIAIITAIVCTLRKRRRIKKLPRDNGSAATAGWRGGDNIHIEAPNNLDKNPQKKKDKNGAAKANDKEVEQNMANAEKEKAKQQKLNKNKPRKEERISKSNKDMNGEKSIMEKEKKTLMDDNIKKRGKSQESPAFHEVPPMPVENEAYMLSFLPGSNELQQPFEFEPEVRGFRL